MLQATQAVPAKSACSITMTPLHLITTSIIETDNVWVNQETWKYDSSGLFDPFHIISPS